MSYNESPVYSAKIFSFVAHAVCFAALTYSNACKGLETTVNQTGMAVFQRNFITEAWQEILSMKCGSLTRRCISQDSLK